MYNIDMKVDRRGLVDLINKGMVVIPKDFICVPSQRFRCKLEYDLSRHEECRDCLRRFLCDVFDKEAEDVKRLEDDLVGLNASGKGNSFYRRWRDLVVDLLNAKRKLYHAAVSVIGHAQTYGVLDPIIPRGDMGKFIDMAVAEHVLLIWISGDCYGLCVPVKKDRDLYATKALHEDIF